MTPEAGQALMDLSSRASRALASRPAECSLKLLGRLQP